MKATVRGESSHGVCEYLSLSRPPCSPQDTHKAAPATPQHGHPQGLRPDSPRVPLMACPSHRSLSVRIREARAEDRCVCFGGSVRERQCGVFAKPFQLRRKKHTDRWPCQKKAGPPLEVRRGQLSVSYVDLSQRETQGSEVAASGQYLSPCEARGSEPGAPQRPTASP